MDQSAAVESAPGRVVLGRRLLGWYSQHARDLPWRRSTNAYHVWVSEIMLQQTQVATVVSYFERFIRRFATISELARADETEVLKMWEGLGYYRRARQLHQAAKVIDTHYGGKFPEQLQDVLSLPGIGRYTAGAILSIAFGQRQPILEANTIRLLSRLVAYRDDPMAAAGQRLLWDLSESLLPRNNVAQFNQALMELGSEICSPRQPRCDACPVQTLCPTNTQGLQDEIPLVKRKVAYEDVREAAVIVLRRGRVLIRRCRDGERWAGLWDFPRFALKTRRRDSARFELEENVAQLTGLDVQLGPKWKTIKHGVTRYRITLSCYETTRVTGRLSRNGQLWKWLQPPELADYPLNSTGRKIGRLWIARRERSNDRCAAE